MSFLCIDDFAQPLNRLPIPRFKERAVRIHAKDKTLMRISIVRPHKEIVPLFCQAQECEMMVKTFKCFGPYVIESLVRLRPFFSRETFVGTIQMVAVSHPRLVLVFRIIR